MRSQSAALVKSIVLITLTVIVFAAPAQSGDIKHINREETIKILEAMGYTNVIIGVVIEGASYLGIGGDNTALIAGIAKKDGKSVTLGGNLEFEMLIYDRRIGWCTYNTELDKETNQHMIKIYTKNGEKILRHQ